ncbi:MAG: hypothetical protein ACREI3_00750, partial [Nitrospirales bacterium]
MTSRLLTYQATLVGLVLAVAIEDVGALPLAEAGSRSQADLSSEQSSTSPSLAQDLLAQIPLSFEPNHGQTASDVAFLARGRGYMLFLTKTEAVFAFRGAGGGEGNSEQTAEQTIIRMRLEGANAAPRIEGLAPLPGKSHYFIGNNPAKWHTNVQQYQKVAYRQVYPGIDLVFYGNPRNLEFDFVVAPQADPSQVRLEFQGAQALQLNEAGDLYLNSDGE